MRIATIARHALILLLGLAPCAGAFAQSTVFRFSDLDLRDPHVFVSFLGCRDFTDTPPPGAESFNGGLQASIENDGDGDGLLDLSLLLEFMPLDQGQATNLIDFGPSQCTAPVATTECAPLAAAGFAGDATLQASGQCLTFLPGTVRPYAPAITSTTAPCFVSPEGTLTLALDGIALTLRDAQIAATFVGTPATSLANGLLRGFLTEADANATILPASFPLVGGQPLSILLPGGNGNCQAISDKDANEGVPGWWFYLTFPAAQVAIDAFADGFE